MKDIQVPLGLVAQVLAAEIAVFLVLLVPFAILSPAPPTKGSLAKEQATTTSETESGPGPGTTVAGTPGATAAGGSPGTAGEGTAAAGVTATPATGEPGSPSSDLSTVREGETVSVEPGVLTGAVYDALTGAPIEGTELRIQGTRQAAASNRQGRYVFRNLPSGTYTVVATKPNYIPLPHIVELPAEGVGGINFGMSVTLKEGQIRIVLTWGSDPKDLDANLWLPQDHAYHVYYPTSPHHRGNLTGPPYAQLDLDKKDGQGPETITISQLFPGTYVYGVNKFGTEGATLADSKATVTVFQADRVANTFSVPKGAGYWWSVFQINGSNGTITPVNTLSETSAAPYPFP